MGNYGVLVKKWRKRLMHANVVLAFAIMSIEAALFVVLKFYGYIHLSIVMYFIKYVAFPSGINIMIIALGYKLLSLKGIDEKVKHYVPILTSVAMCFCVSCVHNEFVTVICCFCIPIFMTVIFGNKKMTINVTWLNEILMLISILVGYFDERGADSLFIFDAIISSIILLSSGFCSVVLIENEKEKLDIIRDAYITQINLKEQLLHDQMTGLYNHKGFYKLLSSLITENKGDIVLAILDLDNFKEINDNYGHDKGDKVLMQLTYFLKTNCEKKAFTCRYGGEEFAVIFQDFTIKETGNLIDNIREEFSNHVFEDLENSRVTFSCGLAKYVDGMTVEELFTCADKAMYRAKNTGKNKIVVYRETVDFSSVNSRIY